MFAGQLNTNRCYIRTIVCIYGQCQTSHSRIDNLEL